MSKDKAKRKGRGMTRLLAVLPTILCISFRAPALAAPSEGKIERQIESVGQERLRPDTDKPEKPRYLKKFGSMPNVDRHAVHFRDANGRGTKQRRLGSKEIKGKSLRYELAYGIQGGNGAVIARWKEPTNLDDLNEDSPVEYSEILDSSGNLLTKIPGCYQLWASPDMSFFVGNECTGGMFHATGRVAFFDRSGTKTADIDLFRSGGNPYVAFSEDSEKVLVMVRGSGIGGNPPKSGLAAMDRHGKVLWKKEESDWQIQGPLDALRSYEKGQIGGHLMASPWGDIYILSNRGITAYSLKTGALEWEKPIMGALMAADKDWLRVAVLASGNSIILLNPRDGKQLASFQNPCEGGPYQGEEALQLRGDIVFVKTGETSFAKGELVESARCYAAMSYSGEVIWKRVSRGKQTLRQGPERNEDVFLSDDGRVIIKDDTGLRAFRVSK